MRSILSSSSLFVLFACPLFVACSATSESPAIDGGTVTTTDVEPSTDSGVSTPDTSTRKCTANPVYSGSITGEAEVINPGKAGEALVFRGGLAGGDRLVISMSPKFGTPGYHTGRYEMTDGTKVLESVVTDVTAAGSYTAQYKPTAGSLEVTSVTGSFRGTITGGHFNAATEAGCAIDIPSLTFTGVIE